MPVDIVKLIVSRRWINWKLM